MYLTACSYKKTSTWAGSSVYSSFRYHSLWKLKWEQVSCSKSGSLGVKGNLNWWVDEWAAAAGIEFHEPLCNPQNRCKPFLCHTHTQSSDRDRKPDIFFFVCRDWTLMGTELVANNLGSSAWSLVPSCSLNPVVACVLCGEGKAASHISLNVYAFQKRESSFLTHHMHG